MRSGEHLAQVLDGDPGVERGRREAPVAEQFVHVADVGTATQEMSRAGVPQGVRRDVDADGSAVPLHDRPQADEAQPAAVA